MQTDQKIPHSTNRNISVVKNENDKSENSSNEVPEKDRVRVTEQQKQLNHHTNTLDHEKVQNELNEMEDIETREEVDTLSTKYEAPPATTTSTSTTST